MRRVVAALIDSAATALLGFAGFWVGYHATPCATVSECPPLAPAAVVGVLLFAGLYYLGGYLLHRSTPGQWVMDVDGRE